MEIVEVLKALADETRIRILNVLHKDTLCVCDLEVVLKLSQSNVSRHLAKLKHAGLITSEKQAQWVYYRLDENTPQKHPFVKELLEQELTASPVCRKDVLRLKEYRDKGGCCENSVKIDES